MNTSYWIIERDDGWFWVSGGAVWARDPDDAVRFCREEDVKKALTTLRRYLDSDDGSFLVRHLKRIEPAATLTPSVDVNYLEPGTLDAQGYYVRGDEDDFHHRFAPKPTCRNCAICSEEEGHPIHGYGD